MKVHKDLEELLESYDNFLNKEYPQLKLYGVDREVFLLSNSLALGKPEPLAKNKQTENDFKCAYFQIGAFDDKCAEHCGEKVCTKKS